MKRISVILSTFNGEKYIIEQLESLRTQTRKIDEVIIIDDCSTDSTVPLIRKYIHQYELNWECKVNSKNIGWKKNFVSGLKRTRGDYIFFCDQDDIWKTKKVEKCIEQMERNPEILLLVTDYDKLVYKRNGKTKLVSSNKVITNAKKYLPQRNYLYVRYPGCTYCMKAEIKKYYDIYWDEEIPHDALAWTIASAMDRLYVLPQALIIYRRHQHTATGRSINKLSQRISSVELHDKFIKIYEEIEKKGYYNINISANDRKQIKRWMENRNNILRNRDIIAVLNNLRYLKYYWSIKTFFADVFICRKRGTYE